MNLHRLARCFELLQFNSVFSKYFNNKIKCQFRDRQLISYEYVRAKSIAPANPDNSAVAYTRLFYNFNNQLFRIQLSRRGYRRIFNFKTANSGWGYHSRRGTQYVKRDVTSPRPQLRAPRGLIKRNSRPTCKRWSNIRERVNDRGIVCEIRLIQLPVSATFFGGDIRRS